MTTLVLVHGIEDIVQFELPVDKSRRHFSYHLSGGQKLMPLGAKTSCEFLRSQWMLACASGTA